MYNILDYIRFRGDLSFEVSPFNPVDNLILTRLAYVNFEGVEATETLSDIAARYRTDDKKWRQMEFTIDETRPLLDLCGKTERFGRLTVSDFIDIVDVSEDTQFCAMTFRLSDDMIYIAFRGTDESVVGWKEDFNMIYLDEVPGQRKSHLYLSNMMDRYRDVTIYVGGHSKGGNLAVYAAANVDEAHQHRIARVFSNDGPGFNPKLIESDSFKRILPRVASYVPENSIVGVLFSHAEKQIVVRTDRKHVFDHCTFMWRVMGPDFVYEDEMSRQIKVLAKTIKSTINSMPTEDRKLFVDMVFSSLDAAGVKSVLDLDKNGLRKLLKASSAYNAMDKEKRDTIDKYVNRFFEEGFKNMLAFSELNKIGNRVDAWFKGLFNDEKTV